MSETNNRSGFFVGRNRGKITKLPAKQTWKKRPATLKGKISRRSAAVRAVIREVSGFSLYEKRTMELLRAGEAHKDKKARKLCRHKIGTHRRSVMKIAELNAQIELLKKKGQ